MCPYSVPWSFTRDGGRFAGRRRARNGPRAEWFPQVYVDPRAVVRSVLDPHVPCQHGPGTERHAERPFLVPFSIKAARNGVHFRAVTCSYGDPGPGPQKNVLSPERYGTDRFTQGHKKISLFDFREN